MGLFTKKRHVKPIFVGSYGNDLTRGIYVFHFDTDNGEFLKKKYYKSPANPSAFYKRERFIYVSYLNKTGKPTDGGLWQYASMDLQFGLASKTTNQGKTFISSYVNEDRSCAYAVDYYNSEVVVIPILKQKIVKVVQTLKHEGHGPHGRYQLQSHPTFIESTPDQKRIFVCDRGIDEIVLYRVVEKGRLERDEENTVRLKPGSGPRKMIFDDEGRYAYVLNELSNTIATYRYEDTRFEYMGEVETYPLDRYDEESYASDIAFMNKDGRRFLFVTNKGHDSVSVFEIGNDGQPHYIEFLDTDENPVALITVNDRFVIVASQKGGTLESFELKLGESKGVLFETHYRYMVGEPVCLIEGRGI